MSTLTIRNITFLKGEEFSVDSGDIHIDGDTIAGIYSDRAPKGDREIDGSSLIAIPGLVNAHFHILDSPFKEIWPGLTIPELFGPDGVKARHLREGDDEVLIEAVREGGKTLISHGVTTVGIFVEEGIRGLKICSRGLRGLNLNAILLGRPTGKSPKTSDLKQLLNYGQGLAPSGLGAFEDLVLEEMHRTTSLLDKILATHIAEVAVTKNFERARDLYQPHFLVHGNYLNQNQYRDLAKHNIGLVCCIRSGTTFGHPPPPLDKLDEWGVTFGLGTDNAMSNSPSMFRELEYITRWWIARGVMPEKLTAERLLRGATVDGARLLGQKNVGLIEPDYRADLILLKKGEELTPFRGALSILLRGGTHLIDKIIFNGRIQSIGDQE